MIYGLTVVRGLGVLVFILFPFLNHGRGYGCGRGDERFGVTSLDEGLEGLHLPLGQFNL